MWLRGDHPGRGGRRRAAGAQGRTWAALCLPAATGALHKAVVSEDGRVHLVEEIQLFPRPEPVLNLQLAPTQVRRGLQRRWAGAAGSGAGTREHGTLRLSSRAQCLQASQAAS